MKPLLFFFPSIFPSFGLPILVLISSLRVSRVRSAFAYTVGGVTSRLYSTERDDSVS